MSFEFGIERTVVRTRKRNTCDGCRREIEVGSSAKRWAGKVDGEFHHIIMHPDCRKAEIAFNAMIGSDADTWWPLSQIDAEDVDWLRGAFPKVAIRMGLGKPEMVS